MSDNGLSSRVSNVGSNGSSGSSPSGRKAPPPPKISGPAAAAGGEFLLGIPEQQVQGLLAVPNPPEALALEVVSNGNSQHQGKDESKRSSSSSPSQRTSNDKVEDEELKRGMAIIHQQFKLGADEKRNLHARLKKSEQKTRIKTRECEDLSSEYQELCNKFAAQSTELAVVHGQVRTTQLVLNSLRENQQTQNTRIEQLSAKLQKLEHEKEGWQATFQGKDQQIEKLKRELDQERNDKDSIAQGFATMYEQIKRKKLN